VYQRRSYEAKSKPSFWRVFQNDNDPRITKVGRILRKTSLDELPQFWNVLKGEMSQSAPDRLPQTKLSYESPSVAAFGYQAPG